MAENHETKLYFAIRKETNRLVYISEMVDDRDRGSACNCICPYCGRPLVYKPGHGKRIKHFAHLAENGTVECSAEKANESGLHKMAKKLICESTYINLPKAEIPADRDPDRNKNDDSQQKPLQFGENISFRYQSAQVEVPFDGFKPDICLIQKSGKLFLIEIAVTHFVDADKHERIKAAQLPTIEINISDFLKKYKATSDESKDNFIEKLRQRLIEATENKIWIYHPREQEGIQRLCERNRELEKEYQEDQARKQKELEKRWERMRKEEEWIYQQQRICEQINFEVDALHADDTYYSWCRDQLKQADNVVLEEINRLGICDLKFNTIEDIPFFFDIPVFGEVAFNCDRRIWQAILFEEICYEKLFKQWRFESVNVARIYCCFMELQESLLNDKFVYIRDDGGNAEFQRGDLLCNAIEEYLVHLSALGFVDIRYYYDSETPYSGLECAILHNTLIPQRKEYADFLKEVLKSVPDTNDPFGYFQKKWEQKNVPFTRVRSIDTFERLIKT